MEGKQKIAIVPGSFDPMTLGHLDLVKLAASRYDKVYVAVMVNSSKKSMFDADYRTEIARLTVKGLRNVEVIYDNGMLVDLYEKLHADAVVKGWRNQKDYDYEIKMAEWNRDRNPRFVTELVSTGKGFENVSSTLVRERLERGESAADLMMEEAWAYVQGLVREKREAQNIPQKPTFM